MTESALAKAVEDVLLDYYGDRDLQKLLRSLAAIVRAARR